MTSSLSNLADNVAEGIYRIKCKYRDNDKKNKQTVELNAKVMSAFLNTQILKIV